MELNEYQKLAMRTSGTYAHPIDMLANAALGLCGESGEVADHLKKALFQGHSLDEEKLISELGDVLWYVALGAHALGVSLEDIAARNIDKLRKRYPDGFSAERSVNRNDTEG